MKAAPSIPWWAWAWPVLAWVILAILGVIGASGVIVLAAGAALIATVFAAVYHAEVVAHRIGEPFGTLVLAVAVTIIEVALIVSVMVGAAADKSGLARDTIFAAVMIVCNGSGLCLLSGRHAASRPGIPSRRSERRACRVGRADHSVAHSAERHHERPRPHV